MRFEWHPVKAASNLQKHHVSFDEAVSVFADPLARVTADALHHERFAIIGQSARTRLLLVVYAENDHENPTLYRIISARHPTRTEQRSYEDEAP